MCLKQRRLTLSRLWRSGTTEADIMCFRRLESQRQMFAEVGFLPWHKCQFGIVAQMHLKNTVLCQDAHLPALPTVTTFSRTFSFAPPVMASTKTLYEAPDVSPISVALLEVPGRRICWKKERKVSQSCLRLQRTDCVCESVFVPGSPFPLCV